MNEKDAHESLRARGRAGMVEIFGAGFMARGTRTPTRSTHRCGRCPRSSLYARTRTSGETPKTPVAWLDAELERFPDARP